MGNQKQANGRRVFDDVYSFPQDSQDLADDIYLFGNLRVGTSQQRQQLAPALAKAGMLWSETDTGFEYFYDGSGWVRRMAPFAMASGQTTLGQNLANGANATTPIVFPTNRFSVPPNIVLASNGIVYLYQGSVTAAGFTLGIANRSGSALSTAPTVTWTAVQMTPANASG